MIPQVVVRVLRPLCEEGTTYPKDAQFTVTAPRALRLAELGLVAPVAVLQPPDSRLAPAPDPEPEPEPAPKADGMSLASLPASALKNGGAKRRGKR